MEAILCLKEGVEERNTLDVVPVVMRNKDVGIDALATVRLRPAIPQHPQSRSTVQNKPRAVRGH